MAVDAPAKVRFAGDPAKTFDRRRPDGHGPRDTVRSFRTAATLGWRIEANWTDPTLFLIYSVAKPLAAALLLIVMLDVVGGAAARQLRGFVIVGSALWAFVQSGMSGLAQAVLEDRERYRMLKYLCVSPEGLVVLLLGRGAARILIGAFAAAITLVFGIAFVGVRFDPLGIDWLLLVSASAIGFVSIVALGMAMAAVCLQSRQEAWSYPEAVAGALFLLCGVVFPLAVLPQFVQAVGLAIPITWWIEAVRDAVLAGAPSSIGGPGSLWTSVTGSARPDATTLLIALLATGAVGTLASALLFRISERRAKARGLLDQTTGS
ncbi:MAG: ABC transporter permease [Chloroflexota bacterium]